MRENIKIKILQNMLEEVTKKYDYFISQQNEKMRVTFEMATKDKLTGLYNRQYLEEYSSQALGRIKRHNTVLISIFIDLDNFKHVNDYYGHLEGDRVLKEVAEIFKQTFRDYDIIIRYGGDEFIVLVEDKQYSHESIKELMELFVKRIESSLKKFKISASYGCAVAPYDAQTMEELIEISDERMYLQKQAKKCKQC
jgi:diguanylate cyclase (GGDEF)-like protein